MLVAGAAGAGLAYQAYRGASIEPIGSSVGKAPQSMGSAQGAGAAPGAAMPKLDADGAKKVIESLSVSPQGKRIGVALSELTQSLSEGGPLSHLEDTQLGHEWLKNPAQALTEIKAVLPQLKSGDSLIFRNEILRVLEGFSNQHVGTDPIAQQAREIYEQEMKDLALVLQSGKPTQGEDIAFLTAYRGYLSYSNDASSAVNFATVWMKALPDRMLQLSIESSLLVRFPGAEAVYFKKLSELGISSPSVEAGSDS